MAVKFLIAHHATNADGQQQNVAKPATDVQGLTQAVVDLAAHRHWTCALQVDGKVMCWGADDTGGLLGVGDLHRNVPTAMPVNFGNPFAKRAKKEGIELAHEGPSRSSLRDTPELGARARGRPNPYAKRIKVEGIELQVGRKRPARGSEVGPTIVKSVRLPPAIWARLEAEAHAEGVALHALLRAALLAWLDAHAA